MTDTLPSEYDKIRAEAEQALIEFLQSQLEDARTLVLTAKLATIHGDVENAANAKDNAIRISKLVEKFVVQVNHPAMRHEIETSLAELAPLASRLLPSAN